MWKKSAEKPASARLHSTTGRRKCTAEKACGISQSGQTDAGCIKKVLKPSQRRKMVTELISDYQISLRRAFEVSLLSTSVWYYKHHRGDDGPLRLRIKSIAEIRVRYGIERIAILEELRQFQQAKSRKIQVDKGSEFISKEVDRWAYEHQVEFVFSRPGKPTDNPYIESFNGSFRDECLNAHWFLSLEDAKEKIKIWRKEYNTFRPHSCLGHLTPEMFIEKQVKTAEFPTVEHS